jgi:hypothetical protein
MFDVRALPRVGPVSQRLEQGVSAKMAHANRSRRNTSVGERQYLLRSLPGAADCPDVKSRGNEIEATAQSADAVDRNGPRVGLCHLVDGHCSDTSFGCGSATSPFQMISNSNAIDFASPSKSGKSVALVIFIL